MITKITEKAEQLKELNSELMYQRRDLIWLQMDLVTDNDRQRILAKKSNIQKLEDKLLEIK